jgi:tetratricopeptide (TPR) repeat protein
MLIVLVAVASGAAGPEYAALEKAFARLQARDYPAAIAQFREAAQLAPARADIRKNLAYTLLKIGDTEPARDQFEEAMRLDPADLHVALEFAFLCHETGRTREARLVFDRIRKSGDEASRATAEQAFRNIDQPLEEGIARWLAAAERDPGNFSAHLELARLAEQRSNWPLAAEHYEAAWKLKPADRKMMVDVGRAWKETGRGEAAIAMLLAASRGAEPRAAEHARQLLPKRYPYVYEFRQALAVDAGNLELHRELAYLLLEMGNRAEAEKEFRVVVERSPEDRLSVAQLGFLLLHRGDADAAKPLLERVLTAEVEDELSDRVRSALALPKPPPKQTETQRRRISEEALEMGDKSLQAGYLKDALKYLSIAHDNDPLDFKVMLKLGWANNLSHNDKDAVHWFQLASQSPDPSIAAEAQRAYGNLRPEGTRVRTSAWMLPFFSSRWNNVFAYGQMKTEIRTPLRVIRPYASMRVVGDVRGKVANPFPQYLSESAVIFGAGVATPVYRGIMGWAEAGRAVTYVTPADGGSRVRPDYRGGISFTRGFGRLLGSTTRGAFFENHEDAVFVSRFNNSVLLYSQNKFGYTAGPGVQFYWNANVTGGARGEYWGNFAETGPGVRLRWAGLPDGLHLSLDVLRGVHTINRGNPRRPNFIDVRAGFWYAFAR